MERLFLMFIVFFGLVYFANAGRPISTDPINEKIDTAAIVKRAKLFVLSRHTFFDLYTLEQEIDSIKYSIHPLGKEFIFIKLYTRYYCLGEPYQTSFKHDWCDCVYYIAYSPKEERYFLLGGFRDHDIFLFYKAFINSLSLEYEVGEKKIDEFLFFLLEGSLKEAEMCFPVYIER